MKVLISGGGTGGHIFPAISIANAIREIKPDTEFLFIGALGRMEMDKVPAEGYRIIGLPVRGFIRPLFHPGNIQVLIDLYKSIRQAKKIIRNFQPDVAVGVGGYASAAALKAAYALHVPYVLQEQNGFAGVTNQKLARHAEKICVAYPGMERFFPAEKIIMTGNRCLFKAGDGLRNRCLSTDGRRSTCRCPRHHGRKAGRVSTGQGCSPSDFQDQED